MESLSEELQSLTAIFGNEVTYATGPEGSTVVSVLVDQHTAATFTLRGDYPHSVPYIKLSDHCNFRELEKSIADTAIDSIGAPMLFQMTEATRDWIRSHRDSSEGLPRSVSPSPAAGSCKFFQQGKCRFGDKCKFIHSGQLTSEAVDKPDVSRQMTQTSIASTRQSEDTDIVEKKTSMRQATDVISRILWDGDLPTEQFSIGYLDRFVGIIEKPFAAFSWEDIASVGPNVLSVPKHRIQYFKFREQIVWDKRCQMDNFYGSRGDTTIDEIVRRAVVEVVQEEPAGLVVGELDTSPGRSPKHSNKDRPTHFVCLQITNHEAVAKIRKIQEHIITISPQLASGASSEKSFHITLCMLRLDKEQDIANAKAAFEKIAPYFLHLLPRCVQLSLSGVDNFKDRLVYIKVAPHPALTKLVGLIMERLQAAGIQTPGNHSEYTPHITIVKMSRPMQKELNVRIAGQALYSKFLNEKIGDQQVETIHLCSMTGPKQQDGFFPRLQGVSNSLIHLMPSLSPPLESAVHKLHEVGKISEQQMVDCLDALHSKEEKKFDQVIELLYSKSIPKSKRSSTIVILRGVPGSGKSFLAQNCKERKTDSSKVAVCSADDYFEKGGPYKFRPELVPEAHDFCLTKFLECVSDHELVVVDNTHSQKWEYLVYQYLGQILQLNVAVVEVPCPSEVIAEKFRHRNTHKIDSTAHNATVQRWETDSRALLVPPRIAYPTSSPIKAEFAFKNFTNPEREQVLFTESHSQLFALYTGVFLTPEAQWMLVTSFPPAFPNVHADHVTLSFQPSPQDIASTRIGQRVKVRVTSQEASNGVQAVHVQLPSNVHCSVEHPHITISTDNYVSPKLSGTILGKGATAKPVKSLILEGTVGMVVRKLMDSDKQKDAVKTEDKLEHFIISSKTIYQEYLARKLYPVPADLATQEVTVHTGSDIITDLYLFDFDGTLFHSPYPEEGKPVYEKHTGNKWVHRGWWSYPESLEPPLHVPPGPAVPDFHSHFGRANSVSFVLTSRINKTRSPLKALLENAGVFPDRVIMKPDDSKDMPGYIFKGIAVKHLLSEFPNLKRVKFWDDSEDNLKEVGSVVTATKPDVEVELLLMEPPATDLDSYEESLVNSTVNINSCLEAHLLVYGHLPTNVFKQAATIGVQFIAQQFSSIIGFEGNSNLLAYLFGSFPIGRYSDVDLCLIGPPTHTPLELAEALATQLQLSRVKFVHVGRSSRCPRLKVCLEFKEVGCVEFDVVFAVLGDAATLDELEDLSLMEVQSRIKNGDPVSKAAFAGPVFLHHILQAIQDSVGMSTFAAVVELMVQILKTNHLKGNAFHCIRTFHIVQLLADFVKSKARSSPSPDWNSDSLFKEFLVTCSQLPVAKWKKLLGDVVATKYINKLISLFAKLRSQVECERFPSPALYRTLRSQVKVSNKTHTNVAIRVSAKDKVLLWKMACLVEAKLYPYTWKLLDSGVSIVPCSTTTTDCTCTFSFFVTKSTKTEAVQHVFGPFWTELAELKQQGDVSIELLFDRAQEMEDDSSIAMNVYMKKFNDLVSDFKQSEAKELRLSPQLTAYERKLVHEVSERMGVEHKTNKDGAPYIVLRKP